MPGTVRLFELATILLVGGACSDEASGPARPASWAGQLAGLVGSAAENAQTIDDQFAEVAAGAPGFGGVFVDSAGSLVIKVTVDADRKQVMTALQSVASGDLLRSAAGASSYPLVRFEDAQYDVRDLIRWRSGLRGAWLEGITLVDVDERANRLRLGVRDETVAGLLRARLSKLAVPLDAVLIRVMPPDVQRSTVGDRFRPIPGGVRSSYVYDAFGSSGACTVMANVITDLGLGFVIPGHCSYRQGGSPDMTSHYQNTVSPSNFVGYELVDSPVHSCPENTDGGCRYADAAFVGYDSSSFAQLGYIARTAGTAPLVRRTIDAKSQIRRGGAQSYHEQRASGHYHPQDRLRLRLDQRDGYGDVRGCRGGGAGLFPGPQCDMDL